MHGQGFTRERLPRVGPRPSREPGGAGRSSKPLGFPSLGEKSCPLSRDPSPTAKDRRGTFHADPKGRGPEERQRPCFVGAPPMRHGSGSSYGTNLDVAEARCYRASDYDRTPLSLTAEDRRRPFHVGPRGRGRIEEQVRRRSSAREGDGGASEGKTRVGGASEGKTETVLRRCPSDPAWQGELVWHELGRGGGAVTAP